MNSHYIILDIHAAFKTFLQKMKIICVIFKTNVCIFEKGVI